MKEKQYVKLTYLTNVFKSNELQRPVCGETATNVDLEKVRLLTLEDQLRDFEIELNNKKVQQSCLWNYKKEKKE